MINFNIPFVSGKETEYIQSAIANKQFSGDGNFSKLCSDFFKDKFSLKNNFLTTSGTDALEMAAILANIKEGDEVIVPSFTFTSSANAFVLRGAKIIFADSMSGHPNIDHEHIEKLITKRTKAIVLVHYGGVACEMDFILNLARNYNLIVIEDAAHAFDSYYKGIPLGSIGNFGAFSFHETKNVQCGEGGMLVINDRTLLNRAEIIREKGTNRKAFFRSETEKYEWVDIGSSFLPSEILSAFLYAQLESLEIIQQKRKLIWNTYFSALNEILKYGYELPVLHSNATNNASVFYLICPSLEKRSKLINHLYQHKIKAAFHYQPLHLSKYYLQQNSRASNLPNSVKYGNTLLRLPLFPDLSANEQEYIIQTILTFVKNDC